jgi:hypothetical protein
VSHSRTSWREIGTIVGLALLITAWFTFPLWLQPGRWGRFDTGDGQFSIWNVAWVTHALASPRDDLANANIFYPASDALFFS